VNLLPIFKESSAFTFATSKLVPYDGLVLTTVLRTAAEEDGELKDTLVAPTPAEELGTGPILPDDNPCEVPTDEELTNRAACPTDELMTELEFSPMLLMDEEPPS
jgi:hypothetical protein